MLPPLSILLEEGLFEHIHPTPKCIDSPADAFQLPHDMPVRVVQSLSNPDAWLRQLDGEIAEVLKVLENKRLKPVTETTADESMLQ